MYLNTNYQASGVGALLNYIEKDRPLRNSAGREVTDRERENFIEKSERHRFERELRISPDPAADVDRADLERETERYLRDFTRDRPSVRAVYAYHTDAEHEHVHVALTGERRDLYLDREDLERDRERLADRLERGRERTRDREPERDRELARDVERKREQEQERERGRDLGIGR